MRSAVVAFVIAFFVIVMFGGMLARGVRMICSSSSHFSDGRAGVSEEKSLSPTVGTFHIVHSNGPINVVIKPGSTPSLTFQARADVLPFLTSEVVDGVLTIGMNDHGPREIGEVSATIVTPTIDGVTLNGSGNVEVQGVKATDFVGMINGSGNLTAAGAADSATFSVEGSGNIDANELVSANVKVSIAGSGNADVNANKKLDATIAGSGDIHYTGNPGDLHRMVAGSGTVGPAD